MTIFIYIVLLFSVDGYVQRISKEIYKEVLSFMGCTLCHMVAGVK